MNDAPSRRYESSLETYPIKVAGRWTSVRLEPAMIAALKDIARAEGSEVGEICTRLARGRAHGSLASALRLYVLQHYRERAVAPAPDACHDPVFASDARDYVMRADVGLDKVGRGEPCLGLLLDYWKVQAKGARYPAFADLRLDALAAAGLDRHVHLLDIAATDPDDFHLIRQAPLTMIHRIGDNTRLKTLGDSLYAREIKADYNAVKFRGRPVLQVMSVRVAEGALKYQRLLLPCLQSDGRIGGLMVGVTALSRLTPSYGHA